MLSHPVSVRSMSLMSALRECDCSRTMCLCITTTHHKHKFHPFGLRTGSVSETIDRTADMTQPNSDVQKVRTNHGLYDPRCDLREAPPVANQFQRLIQELMDERGIENPSRLATMANLHRNTVRSWLTADETVRQRPTPEALAKVAKALNVPVQTLNDAASVTAGYRDVERRQVGNAKLRKIHALLDGADERDHERALRLLEAFFADRESGK